MRKKYVKVFLCLQFLFLFGCRLGSVDLSFSQPNTPVLLKKLLILTKSIAPAASTGIITQPLSQTVSVGSNVTFSVTVSDASTAHYQWLKGGTATGSDASTLTIASAAATDAGTYTVRITCTAGEFTSNPATLTVIPAALGDRSFVFGVWLQTPEDTLNGKTVAQNYKDIGINTYIGLWQWPNETGMYPGYALASMKALKDAGMNVYAGNDQAAVNWINSHPEYWDIFKGYLLGDEPDMNRDSSVQAQADANTPLAWKALGDALRSYDSTRDIYANFGKPFSKDVWYGKEYGQTGSQASDFQLYVTPTDIISSDFYGITDPWENPENHGIWTYGRAVRNTMKWSNCDGKSRPVWGFVEASAPWTDASSTRWMYQRMPASYIMPIAWNMVVSGAQGVLYFCHDFSPNSLGSYAALLEPGMPAAIKAANESIAAYGAVLLTPTITGTTVTVLGDVDVLVLTKQFQGSTYVFAMGNGNANYRDGDAVDADIKVSGQTGTKTVSVLNDSRTVTMTGGTIHDHFEPYELHIYKID